jgi:hypothetical protein
MPLSIRRHESFLPAKRITSPEVIQHAFQVVGTRLMLTGQHDLEAAKSATTCTPQGSTYLPYLHTVPFTAHSSPGTLRRGEMDRRGCFFEAAAPVGAGCAVRLSVSTSLKSLLCIILPPLGPFSHAASVLYHGAGAGADFGYSINIIYPFLFSSDCLARTSW